MPHLSVDRNLLVLVLFVLSGLFMSLTGFMLVYNSNCKAYGGFLDYILMAVGFVFLFLGSHIFLAGLDSIVTYLRSR